MFKKINIAIIGCGRIAGHHCRAITLNNDYNLVAVCDLNKDLATTYSKEFGVKSYSDYRIMINDNKNIDLISIVTPSGMHFEHGSEILNDFKKSIVVEKPTFMTPNQISDAYKIAKKNNLDIFPVFQNRYNKAVQRVKKSLDEYELGKKRIISVRVRWCRPQKYYDMSKWRGTFSHDGGALTNQGIHHIDLLRYLGGEIESVNCTMKTLGVTNVEVEDTAVATFKYKDNSVGTLEVTTSARPDDFEASISIVGSNGLAQIGGIAVNMLEIFSLNPSECTKYSDDFSDLPDRGKVYGRGHMSMYKDIADHINGKNIYPISEKECLETIRLLHSCYASDELNEWVNINENIHSTRLGKENNLLSEEYRTK